MKGFTIILFILSLCIIPGCQSEDLQTNYPFLKQSPVTILFSNDLEIEKENSYYEALLDFKRIHPDQLASINVVTTEDDALINHFDVHTFPTLLLIDDSNVLLRIEGVKETYEIFDYIEASLQVSTEESF
ncbi:hypothetical protein LGQ02_13580 [Bacillus shivajii]|uniref:hypothetical protein n=1 Tax=Bacillus shivajii TaxID=1983719 RepID=UPI001CFBAFAD|nr:hypothetical protein [Bacillus shivajii]UCZ51884.1 hypothetical protein LGQ02_13580 [Bacillus shivajii]